MKPKGILFAEAMRRAIREGRKTMARRVLKSQPPHGCSAVFTDRWQWTAPDYLKDIKLPYFVGQKLYVKEPWAIEYVERHRIAPDFICIRYQDDGQQSLYSAPGEEDRYLKYKDAPMHGPWKSPLFMPRWAARTWLEVVSVKVERVQEISYRDAIAEGCICVNCDIDYDGEECHCVEKFAALWNSIHGPGAWDRNDWVAAVSFKLSEAPE